MKVFVAGGPDKEIYGKWIYGYEKASSVSTADLVVLVGGADVDPSRYGENSHPTTRVNKIVDESDHRIIVDALVSDIPIVGICRGSQFLCVEAGGTLVQNCDNHGIMGTHDIITSDGDVYAITSTHHQMANPMKLVSSGDAKIIASAFPTRSTFKVDGDDKEISELTGIEPEIVYYEHLNALGIQGHPEYMEQQSKIVAYLNVLINKLVNGDDF